MLKPHSHAMCNVGIWDDVMGENQVLECRSNNMRKQLNDAITEKESDRDRPQFI